MKLKIKAFEPIIEEMNSNENIKIRIEAAKYTPMYGKKSVEPLYSLLQKEENKKVRLELISSLGKIGGPDVSTILIDLLSGDKDVDVRKESAFNLGLIGDSIAIKPLMESVLKDEFFVKLTSIESLGKLKSEIASDILIDNLGACLRNKFASLSTPFHPQKIEFK